MTPYYEDGTVTIWHGDCREILPPTEYPARIITDPPYGTGAYETDTPPDLDLLADWVTGCPTVAVFGYPELLAYWCVVMRKHPSEWVTWWPTNKPSARTRLLPRESEHIAIFGEVVGAGLLTRPRSDDAMTRQIAAARGNDVNACRLGDVWRDPSPGAGFNGHLRLHPNEKPLSVMHKLVVLCSDPGDVIFDPYAGSGTTLMAAKANGRRAIGVELEERFCEIAANRCAQEVLAA